MQAGTIPAIDFPGDAVRASAPARRTILAVIPARNEAATVADIVRRTLGTGLCDVLVVDDNSGDTTGALAAQAGAAVLSAPFTLGAWGATQTGMRYAQRNLYQTVVTLDADGQHHPEEVPALIAALHRGGANVIIGTYSQRMSRARRIAGRYFRALTRLDVEDFTSGLRAYDRRAIRALASREASLLDYQDMGVLMLLNKKGLVLRESPTIMSPRRAGASRVFASWLLVARYMLHTTVLCFAQLGVRPRIGVRSLPA
jgi:glycosyltransferase involved in cell wall biosynthesis